MTFFSIIVCEHDAKRVVPIRSTRFTIEREGASNRAIIRTPTANEPRGGAVHEVRVRTFNLIPVNLCKKPAAPFQKGPRSANKTL